VVAMVNYLYDALCKYFGHLCNVGYMPQSQVDKLLILSSIQRMVDCDFRGYLNESDYNRINDALYKLYGTSCLVPYPDYYSNNNRTMYTCSISELAHRVTRLEENGAGQGPAIEDKDIIIPSTESTEVEDVDI
jgi:hypothetical protein